MHPIRHHLGCLLLAALPAVATATAGAPAAPSAAVATATAGAPAAPSATAASPVAQADAWLTAKDPRAGAAVAALLKAQPENAAVQVLQARLLLQQDKVEAAVDAADEAVDLAPGSARAHYWRGIAYSNRIGQVGMVSKAMMAPKIRDSFERAVELDPALHEARASLFEYYLQAPAVVGGGVDKARAQAIELLRRDPASGQHARGRLAQVDGQPVLAAQAFAAAHAARPAHAGYRMAAGVGYQDAKMWPQAFALFEAWIREEPANAGAWYQLGRTAALSGQKLDQGKAALETFLRLPAERGQPQPHHAWFRLGQVQAHAGEREAARASLQRVIAADPDHAEARAALSAL